MIITTGRAAEEKTEPRARAISERWGIPYHPRRSRSISAVKRAARLDDATPLQVVVVEADRLSVHLDDGSVLFYHPGMGLNRLRRVMRGEDDWMIKAMDLKPGDRILDATAGLASDLLVASFIVGKEGLAVGLESELLLALVVGEGVRTYTHRHHEEVTDSLRRIQYIHADYRDFLSTVNVGAFDVVYFDPMFSDPVAESQQMIPIRKVANTDPLTVDSLQLALNVATKRVVVKDRPDGPYVNSGWFHTVVGGRGSRIVYCIAKP